MTDIFSKEKRSQVMARVKSNDTKPEMLVRRFLHARGFRYGLHNKKLPGSPDIVLRRYKTVIFVHGCYWHGHEGCKYSHLPQSNTEFWEAKILRNRERDAANVEALQAKGWNVIQIWECDLKTKDRRERTLAELANLLVYKKFAGRINPHFYLDGEEYDYETLGNPPQAAEPIALYIKSSK